MIKNYLFVYPPAHIKKKIVSFNNVFFFNGKITLEDFFKNKGLVKSKNDSLKKNFNDYEESIKRHFGTWQRWLNSWENEVSKYRELEDLLLIISDWLEINNISKIIFFTSAPHHVDTSLIEIAARSNKIKTLFFYYEEIFTKNFIPIYRYEFTFKYIKNKKFKASKKISDLSIKNFLNQRNYLNKASWVPKSSFYKKNFLIAIIFLFFWHTKKNFSNRNKISRYLQEINLLEDLLSIFNQKKYLSYLAKEIKKISLNSLKNKITNNIIIYAHYQPESTTLSEGGEFKDQIKIINYLKKSGYSGDLYFKEHPSSLLYIDRTLGPTRVGLWRNKKFFNNLIKKNVNIIFDDSNIKNKIIVTCSGSVALERSLNGFKTIICGYPWYGEIPGTIRIENINWENIDELNFLRTYSENIKIEAKKYISDVLSYSLQNNSKTNHNDEGFYSMLGYIEYLLKDAKS